MKRMYLFLLFALFLLPQTALAKSCLHKLPSGHHAVVATYNDKNECIIHSCVAPYKLFHNECLDVEKEKYNDLKKQEDICTDSGGSFEKNSLNIFTCVCSDDKYLIHNNCDGIIIPDCEHKCKIYNQNDCDRWEIIQQHVLRGNINAFKTCMNKLKSSKYGDLSVRQSQKSGWKYLYYSILESAYKGDFSFMDAAIDAGMLTLEDYVDDDVGIGHRGNSLTGPGTLISDVLYFGNPCEDYHKGHIKVLKYLNEHKNMLDVNKKYLMTGDYNHFHNTAVEGDDPLYAYPLEYLINDLMEISPIYHCNVSPETHDSEEDVKLMGKQMVEYLLNQNINLSIMDPYEFSALHQFMHSDSTHLYWVKWLHNEKGIKFKPGTPPFCAPKIADVYDVYEKNCVDELNEILKEDCPECVSDELIKQRCEWKKQEKEESEYEKAKKNEQSLANRTLTALTTAATGIGGMELAMGLAEQKADKEAEADMTAYIETMRCTYGDGKQVKAGSEEIELPGGNDQELMNLRTEYFALASDLKERKTALGMKPGIESEEIIDKASTGLYDDESLSIDSGAYASLYRAQMQGSEKDQSGIDEDKNASKKRVIAGGVLSGVGVAGGIIGNSIINGKLGEMIKENKNKNSINKNNKSVIDKLKKGLKSTGMTDVDKLDFSNLDLSSMSSVIDKIDFSSMSGLKGKSATDVLNTSNSSSFSSSFGNILGDKNATLFQ